MGLAGRDVISVFDLSNAEIEQLMDLADEMEKFSRGRTDVCSGKVMAALFYEPSTRTRFSFEAAMQRLGGGVITCAEAGTTSAAKGESLADTVRIVECYADVIVMRHPLEGSAALAAEYARAPVINGGDGAHEHPTQTLLDLYTLRKEHGGIRGASVLLVGDLKYGRAARSLAYGLARFGAQIICVAPQGLEMEARTAKRLAQLGSPVRQYPSMEALAADDELRAAIAGAGGGRGAARGGASDVMALFDAIYVTRVQKERFPSAQAFEAVKSSYAITVEVLKRTRSDTLIMHPLPRVDELDYGIDADPRATYFRQAGYGVPMRMALLAAILGKAAKPVEDPAWHGRPLEAVPWGGKCSNPRCVSTNERYAVPKFVREKQGDPILCAYCERPAEGIHQ
jgi:aspartate carbamoyltransferase catalytic subunit